METTSPNNRRYVRNSQQTSTKHEISISSLDMRRLFYRQKVTTPVCSVLHLYFLDTKQLRVFRYARTRSLALTGSPHKPYVRTYVVILLTSKLFLFLIYFPCDVCAFRRLHSRANPCFSVRLLKSEIAFIRLGKDVKSENITSLISSVSINQPTNQPTDSLTS
jgi:hypothetical protein